MKIPVRINFDDETLDSLPFKNDVRQQLKFADPWNG